VILLLPRGVVPTLTQLIRDRRARAATPSGPAHEPAVPSGMAGVAR
jgi:hypothetical protein